MIHFLRNPGRNDGKKCFLRGCYYGPIGSRGLLITHSHVGVAKIMGAPFRALCPGEGLERDLAWLAARAGEQAVGVAKLFAHIGLSAVDDLAEESYRQAYSD